MVSTHCREAFKILALLQSGLQVPFSVAKLTAMMANGEVIEVSLHTPKGSALFLCPSSLDLYSQPSMCM